MSVYTLRAIRATPEPTIESFFYSLQEILADLKEKYASLQLIMLVTLAMSLLDSTI